MRNNNWSYVNEEKTTFLVGWSDSIDSWYNIVREDDEKLIVSPVYDHSHGHGLFGITTLLKSAKKVTN